MSQDSKWYMPTMTTVLWWIGLSILVSVLILVFFVVIVWRVPALKDFKDPAAALQSIVTAAAICMGGAFAFYRIQLSRTFYPHMTIEHEISHRLVGTNYIHIAVTATLLNSSKVKIDLRKGFYLLQQISPTSDAVVESLYEQTFKGRNSQDIQWPTLDMVPRKWPTGELVVEPGESHRETFEFIVATGVESVMVYSYFYNSTSSGTSQGWASTTIYDIVDK